MSVPNVIDPSSYSGAAGQRNYEGSDVWYCTTFTAPSRGTYALSFESASYRAEIFIDGRQVGSHVGPYLPFEVRAPLTAGSHTITVRIDWRKPGQRTFEGFHRTWFNWGGLDGAVMIREIGASELSSPTIGTSLPAAGGADVKVGVLVTNHAATRTIVPEGSLSSGSQTIALHFAGVTLGPGQSATDTASSTSRSPRCGRLPPPASTASRCRSGPRAATPPASACASSHGTRAGCCSTGARSTCTARASRRTRSARRRPHGLRRRSHRVRAEGDRWNAAARSIRSSRRCSNASTPRASWCGRASAPSKAPGTGSRTPPRSWPRPSSRFGPSKQHSKTLVRDWPAEFDYVVTVCGQADANCPVFPGKTRVVHVGFEDPPKLTKHLPDGEAKLAVYRRVRDQIRAFI